MCMAVVTSPIGDCALSELQGRTDLWVLSLGLSLGLGKGSARPCGTQVECWSDWRDFFHTPLRDQSQVNLDSYLLQLLPWTLSWFACSHSHKSFSDRETLLTPRCFSLPVREASVAPSSGGWTLPSRSPRSEEGFCAGCSHAMVAL